MSERFIGEIRMFAGNFAPEGWEFCNGQILPIQQNSALFSLLGTTYGGDGYRTFGLPNLQQRVPIGVGSAPGLNQRWLGQKGGEAAVTLSEQQIPMHTHSRVASGAVASGNSASNAMLAKTISPNPPYHEPTNLRPLGPGALGQSGGSQPHNNLQPYLTVSFIIALTGVYPMRN